MPVSDAVEAACWKEAEKLEQHYDRMTSCRVVIAESHRRHRKGNCFEVRIDITVPGAEFVVNREPARHQEDEDVYAAIREAFGTARRRLQDHARRARRQVRTQEPPPRGRVTRLFADKGYGFIHTPDGRELYFHENSVLDRGFERLHPGDEVRFNEVDGEKGPQANSVVPAGRHSRIIP